MASFVSEHFAGSAIMSVFAILSSSALISPMARLVLAPISDVLASLTIMKSQAYICPVFGFSVLVQICPNGVTNVPSYRRSLCVVGLIIALSVTFSGLRISHVAPAST